MAANDADAALALALQLEEEELARQDEAASDSSVVERNVGYGLSLAAKHMHAPSLAAARAVTPIDRLEREATERRNKEKKEEAKETTTETRALLDALLRWFKDEFFSWWDHPPCDKCDRVDGGEEDGKNRWKSRGERSEKRCLGGDAPDARERSAGCSRVEVWECVECSGSSSTRLRYPRHNDVPTLLLETRAGRCGEFANAFTAVCNASGLVARIVVDFSDHVWTEVYDPHERRWLHADPCEAIADEPLLYEAGWGKPPATAVLAFSAHRGDPRVVDVTKRYTRALKTDAEIEENRSSVEKGRERGFRFTGEELKIAAERSGVVPLSPSSSDAAAAAAKERREADEEELSGRRREKEEEAKTKPLPGRTAGDEAWIRARGEDGEKRRGEKEKKNEDDDFATKIRREFERLRVSEGLPPNEAAVKALQKVTAEQQKPKDAAKR